MPARSRRVSKIVFAAAVAASVAGVPIIAAAQPTPYAPPGQYTPQPSAPPPFTLPWPFPQPYAPQPSAPPPYTPQYTSSEEDSFTADKARSWPILRVSQGAGLNFGPRTFAAVSYDLDVTAGYRLALTRRALLAFEGSYSFNTEPTIGGHFAALGLGPELYAGRHIGIGWMPKFVLGATWQGLGVGVRNTLVVPFLMRVFSLEVGHQWLRAGGHDQHEVRAQLGVDLAALGYFVAWKLVSSIN